MKKTFLYTQDGYTTVSFGKKDNPAITEIILNKNNKPLFGLFKAIGINLNNVLPIFQKEMAEVVSLIVKQIEGERLENGEKIFLHSKVSKSKLYQEMKYKLERENYVLTQNVIFHDKVMNIIFYASDAEKFSSVTWEYKDFNFITMSTNDRVHFLPTQNNLKKQFNLGGKSNYLTVKDFFTKRPHNQQIIRKSYITTSVKKYPISLQEWSLTTFNNAAPRRLTYPKVPIWQNPTFRLSPQIIRISDLFKNDPIINRKSLLEMKDQKHVKMLAIENGKGAEIAINENFYLANGVANIIEYVSPFIPKKYFDYYSFSKTNVLSLLYGAVSLTKAYFISKSPLLKESNFDSFFPLAFSSVETLIFYGKMKIVENLEKEHEQKDILSICTISTSQLNLLTMIPNLLLEYMKQDYKGDIAFQGMILKFIINTGVGTSLCMTKSLTNQAKHSISSAIAVTMADMAVYYAFISNYNLEFHSKAASVNSIATMTGVAMACYSIIDPVARVIMDYIPENYKENADNFFIGIADYFNFSL